jgi:hypothetical protein
MAFLRALPDVLRRAPSADGHDVLSSEARGAHLTTFTATRGGRTHTWRTIRVYHLGAGDRIVEILVTIEDQAAFDAFLSR